MAGSYDNEGIAIFCMLLTYALWVKSVKTGSLFWSTLCALAYFYMVREEHVFSFDLCVSLCVCVCVQIYFGVRVTNFTLWVKKNLPCEMWGGGRLGFKFYSFGWLGVYILW